MISVCISVLALTERRLDVLENKTRDYDAVIANIASLDEVQTTLNETRNIVNYYHPLGLNGTTYLAGNTKIYLDNCDLTQEWAGSWSNP